MTSPSYGAERILRFGSESGLVGILTEGINDGRPAVIFLNSGILHRVGSCRLHVKMARALSQAGFYCLRFDFSGIGDSEQRRDALPFEESAPLETLAAMDRIQRLTGIDRFVLVGLCSGADMAHRTALRDPRVVGLHLIDAWAFRNLRFYLQHYGARALKLSSWTNALRVRWTALTERFREHAVPSTEGIEYDLPTYTRPFPPRHEVARDLRALVARGVQMRLLWTGGLADYNHLGQYAELFRDVPFGTTLEEDFLPQADHIITDLDDQDTAIRRAVDWALRLWPSAQATSPSTSSPPSRETAMHRPAATFLLLLSLVTACSTDSPNSPRLAASTNADLVGDYNNTFGIVAGVVNVCAFFPASAGVGVATATFTASGPVGEDVLAGSTDITPVPHCVEVWNASGSTTVNITATLQSQTAGYVLDRIVRITGDGAGAEWSTPLYGVNSASVEVSNLIGGALWFKFRDETLPSGGDGCTPGYWRQSQHFDSWTAPYAPSTLFGSVFANAFPGKTLAEVLALGGGGLDALGRHAVAALLNAANGDVDYDLSVAAVITAFNTAYATGDRSAMTAQKDIFDMLNNQGCPLN